MICYYYPPFQTAGTERSVKFAQYLPQFGYEPYILTTRTLGDSADDKQRRIYRANELLNIYRAFRRRGEGAEPGLKRLTVQGKRDRIKGWVLDHLLIPDAQIGWLPFAVTVGKKIARSEGIDILFSTSPPESAHPIGECLKRLTGKPWVADFRDGWTYESLKGGALDIGYRRRIETSLERGVVSSADVITCATEPLARDFEGRYGLSDRQVVVITNGFDNSEYATIPRYEPSPFFTIVHTGAFSLSSQGRNPYPFLQAVGILVSKHEELRQRLRVVFVGRLAGKEKTFVSELGLDSWVRCVEQVTREESLCYQAKADVLLLVPDPFISSQVPGKLYEYFAAQRPILALAAGNACEELISELANGVVVPPDNEEKIKEAILAFYKQWKERKLEAAVDPARLKRFDRRELTERLAQIFDMALAYDEG